MIVPTQQLIWWRKHSVLKLLSEFQNEIKMLPNDEKLKQEAKRYADSSKSNFVIEYGSRKSIEDIL
jgi:hypothetical protein